jgi:hypothetical protein
LWKQVREAADCMGLKHSCPTWDVCGSAGARFSGDGYVVPPELLTMENQASFVYLAGFTGSSTHTRFEADPNNIRAQTVVNNIKRIEGWMRERGDLSAEAQTIQGRFGTLEPGEIPEEAEGVYDIENEARRLLILGHAETMPLEGYKRMPVLEAAISFRDFVGKPHHSADRVPPAQTQEAA